METTPEKTPNQSLEVSSCIICDSCRKLVPRNKTFHIYTFKCCSIECVKVCKVKYEKTKEKPEPLPQQINYPDYGGDLC